MYMDKNMWTNKELYKKLYENLLKLEILSNNKLLKWVELNNFIKELKELKLDDIKNEIIKRKFEKQKNEINTIWSDRNWYTSWGILIKWKILLEEIIQSNWAIEQTYFSPWSEDQIIEHLKTLIPIWEKSINIIDPYFDNKILYILCLARNVNIRILTKPWKCEANSIKKIKWFNELFDDKKIEIWESDEFHDRFYIIDDNEVYNLWTSLQNPKKATIFTPLNTTESKKVIDDFTNYWNKSNKLKT
jgi:hypothetical protein